MHFRLYPGEFGVSLLDDLEVLAIKNLPHGSTVAQSLLVQRSTTIPWHELLFSHLCVHIDKLLTSLLKLWISCLDRNLLLVFSVLLR